jgi:hypothetical protein
MAAYLANYGAGEEQREKRIHRILIGAGIVLAVAGLYLLTFKTPILERYIRAVQIIKNHREEKQTEEFLALLRKSDYKGAYRLWGCTDEKPCRDYSFKNFMDDWGTQSLRLDNPPRITKSRACGSGVILTVSSNKGDEILWVERDELTIGFSPWPGCPPGR